MDTLEGRILKLLHDHNGGTKEKTVDEICEELEDMDDCGYIDSVVQRLKNAGLLLEG
jgi:predicted DNA-binding protein